jgi:YVTN family beta-propeller protein
VALAVAIGFTLSACSAAPSPSSVPSRAPVATLQRANVVATIGVPGNPSGMLDAFGSIWVSSRHTDTVYRIDPASNAISATISVGPEPSYFASDGTAVWVVESGADALARIDPKTNAVAEVPLGSAAFDGPSVVFGGGAIWAATEAPSIVKVDPVSRHVVRTIALPGEANEGASEPELAFAGGLVWVFRRNGSGDVDAVRRYDSKTLALVDTILAGRHFTVFGLGADQGSVWATDGGEAGGGTIYRIDAATGSVTSSFTLPGGFSHANLSGGRLWLTYLYPLGYAALDEPTGTAGPVRAMPSISSYALWFQAGGAGDLWISDWDDNAVYRINPP